MSDGRYAPGYAAPGARSADGPMVDAQGLIREYAMGGGVVRAVGGIDLRVERGGADRGQGPFRIGQDHAARR